MKELEKINQLEIGQYIVSFNLDTFKTSIRRKDGKKIDQNSEKFKQDLSIIKQSKAYIANMNIMRLESSRHEKNVTKQEEDKLFEFTNYLLNQDR